MADWLRSISTAAPPAKRPKVSPFRLDLTESHRTLPALQEALHGCPAATVAGAYTLPRAAMSAETYALLRGTLRTRPKPSYHMGRRVDKSWDLFVEERGCIAIPRALGLLLVGAVPPERRRIVEAPVVYEEPAMPLLDREAAAARFKSDQETHVTGLVDDLVTQADGPAGFGSAIYSIPTGHGKTASAIHLTARLGQRTLFVVPSESLFDQFEREVHKFLGQELAVGRMWTSNRRKWTKGLAACPVVLTTAASAAAAAVDTEGFGLVVVDEAHMCCTAERKRLFLRFPAKYLVLLTATPERASNHCGAYLEWLGGKLSCYVRVDFSNNRWGGVDVVELASPFSPLKEVTSKGDDGRQYVHQAVMLAKIMRHRERTAWLCREVARMVRDEDRHVVCLGVRVEHLEEVAARLRKAHDVDAGVLVGTHSDGRPQTADERSRALEARVLVAYNSLGAQALDLPRLDTLLILSGGCAWNNATFWTQCIGRIIRDKAVKNKPRIVLPRDRTDGGYFERQVDRAVAQLKALGDGFSFIQ